MRSTTETPLGKSIITFLIKQNCTKTLSEIENSKSSKIRKHKKKN